MSIEGVVGAAIVLVIAIYLSTPSARRPAPARAPTAVDAVQVCDQYALERLKAPRTAKLQPGTSGAADLGDGRFEVRRFVDAQNSFGAMLRNNYICTVRHVGAERWKLESLRM